MSSQSINIQNFKEAIKNGTIPGKFVNGRTLFIFNTLEYDGAKGSKNSWTINVCLKSSDELVAIKDEYLDNPSPALPSSYFAEIFVESGKVGGKIRNSTPTVVTSGKNIGKKNATNVITQALRDALGLFNKQRTKVKEETTGAFDEMPPPMLVKKIDSTKDATLTETDFASGVTVQPKLNGVHFVIYKKGDDIVCYSRKGLSYLGHAHIIENMKLLYSRIRKMELNDFGITNAKELEAYNNSVPYFAGELYLHGKSLNWISGQARKEEDIGILEYHIFDVFFPYAKYLGYDMTSENRQLFLRRLPLNAVTMPFIKVVDTYKVNNMAELNALSKKFLEDGYEGAIARKDAAGYVYSYSDYHSSNLVKIKPVFDSEYPVVDFAEGSKGKEVGAILWICKVPETGKLFTVTPKDMTYDDRKKLFIKMSTIVKDSNGQKTTLFARDIAGTPLTIEYRELSPETKIPLQAKAIIFRTYEGADDKLSAIMSDISR